MEGTHKEYLDVEKFLQYRKTHCNFDKEHGTCCFHDFSSTEIGSYYKFCNGTGCRNYMNYLSIEKMCQGCDYNRSLGGSLRCSFYEETGDVADFDNKEFGEYKCSGYKNGRRKEENRRADIQTDQ
ncbi:MAG: hypothetical protein IJ456_11200 [Bacteroides sp.]|nr:hypothetical protein [Bacteroides sp.]